MAPAVIASAPRRIATVGVALAILTAPTLTAAVRPDAWQRLEVVRRALADQGAVTGSFRQTFVPSGFTRGEEEAGTVHLALPDCLRWDYTAPERKSFLICGSEAHSWVPGEKVGQRSRLDPQREAGLDLLLLPLPALRERYAATETPNGQLELVPREAISTLKRARLTLDSTGRRLEAIETLDGEGNSTRFEFSAWTRSDEPSLFAVPALDWADHDPTG